MTDDTTTDSTARTASWSTGPIRWDNVESDTIGTRTFESVLYSPARLREQMPANYRTQRTTDGRVASHPTSSYESQVPSVGAVAELLGITNKRRSDMDPDAAGGPRENVAVVPTREEIEAHREEFDAGERSYEPAFMRVPFFDERVVGNHGLSAAYGLVVSNARYADDPHYEYDWEADYETGAVTITVEELR